MLEKEKEDHVFAEHHMDIPTQMGTFESSTVSRLDMSVSQFIDEYSKVCVSDQCTLSIILIRRVSLICLTVTAHCVWTMWVLWQLRIVTMTEVETRKFPDTCI